MIKITTKTLKAFSLIELMISLVTMSCILAAFSPIISKKLKTSNSTISSLGMKSQCSKISPDCKLCNSTKCLVCSIVCPNNHYKDTNSCTCIPCSTLTSDCTRCSSEKCLSCTSGYGYYNSSNTCVPCEKGYYSDGTKECMPCPEGKYQDELSQSTCKETPIGNYSDSQASTSYTPCPAGTYQNKLSQKECISCPVGQYQNKTGQIVCKDCPEGKYQDETNSTQCKSCEANNWSEAGSDTCYVCSDDKPCGWIGSGSESSGVCKANQFKPTGSTECVDCDVVYPHCETCGENGCVTCKQYYVLTNGQCKLDSCPIYTVKITTGGKDLCVTQYNMGDFSDFSINVSGVTVVATRTICSSIACCWQGDTTVVCSTSNGDYSGCDRAQCNQYAAEIICDNLNYGGLSWRLPTSDELAGFNPDIYSKGIGNNGLMLCDYNPTDSSSAECLCAAYSACNNRDCAPNTIWSATIFNNSNNAYAYSLYKGVWSQETDIYRNSAASVRCVSEPGVATCADKFGAGCTSCTSGSCSACTSGYILKNGKCEVPTFPDYTVLVESNGKKLYVTQYNMGDKTVFPVNISGVTVVGTYYTECSDNACCWYGETTRDCDSINGDYGGCNRTVCTQYAAEIICNNLNYGGRSWRLSTKDELAGLNLATYSRNKGTSGLMFCDRYSGYGSAYCGIGSSYCEGAYNSSYSDGCDICYVWSSTYSGSYVYRQELRRGYWNSWTESKRAAASVRCVSEL